MCVLHNVKSDTLTAHTAVTMQVVSTPSTPTPLIEVLCDEPVVTDIAYLY